MSAPAVRILGQLASDELSDAFFAEVPGFKGPMVLRALRPEVTVAPEFVARTASLGLVRDNRLALPKLAGTTSDGRAYIVHESLKGASLATKQPSPDALIKAAVEWARALEVLHKAGFALGQMSASWLYLDPPRVDATLAPAQHDADSSRDVMDLVDLIFETIQGLEFERSLRDGLRQAKTASALAAVLTRLHDHFRTHGRVKISGTNFPAIDPDLSGQALGQFQLERVLGEGAMGRVYLGRHATTGKQAAVKVLKAEHARHPDQVQRFIKEAQAVNAIKHEHIVEVTDFGEENGADGFKRVFCVMEVLDGQPLADLETQGPLSIVRACRIAHQVALALDAAHQVGVVHRDIKPENIYLHRAAGDDEFVKVLDFGVAKLLKPIGSIPKSDTMAGTVIGTPEYMAPEQALGGTSDRRIDIYSCGLVLYELLANQQPFRGNTFGRLVVEITTKPAPPLPPATMLGEPIPPALAAIALRCLEKDPNARFQTAAELAAALEPFTSAESLERAKSLPPGMVKKPAAAEAEAAADLASVRPSALPKVLAGVALLIVLGAAAFALLR